MRRRYLGDLPVGTIMARWPDTVRFFVDNHLYCVGCPIAMFHTIIDAAEEHGLDPVELEKALEERVTAIEAVER